MSLKKKVIFELFVGLALLSTPIGRALGASFTVQMTGGLVFSPASLSIAQGDTVTWTNTGAFAHTSTSGSPPTGNGLWDSSIVNPNGAFSVTFTNSAPQTYPYFCSFHYAFGMTGAVTVTNGTAVRPLLEAPLWTNWQFEFVANGKAGNTYVAEKSHDFSQWTVVSTNLASSDRFTIIDPSATNSTGFYRVRLGL